MKLSFVNILPLIVISVLLTGCLSTDSEVNNIDESLIVVNVLDKDFYDDCHIRDSISVPFDQVDSYLERKKDQREEIELVFYCSNRRCSASHFAAKRAVELGFSRVWVYNEGMAEWYRQGLPTVGACQKKYLHKHIKSGSLDVVDDDLEISTEELASKMNLVI